MTNAKAARCIVRSKNPAKVGGPAGGKTRLVIRGGQLFDKPIQDLLHRAPACGAAEGAGEVGRVDIPLCGSRTSGARRDGGCTRPAWRRAGLASACVGKRMTLSLR
jgi:hypothetical protein